MNTSGAGTEAGALYIADNARITEFSPSGHPRRLWGIDVVEKGAGNANEVQQVLIKASVGEFTLSYQGDVTEPIPHNAPAATVESELEALTGLAGAVAVTGGPGDATG